MGLELVIPGLLDLVEACREADVSCRNAEACGRLDGIVSARRECQAARVRLANAVLDAHLRESVDRLNTEMSKIPLSELKQRTTLVRQVESPPISARRR